MKGLAAFLLLVAANPAIAQSQCGPRDEVLKALSEKYGETVVGQGITDRGVIELVVGEKTFSILVSLPNGMTCLAGEGEGWQEMPKKAGNGI